MININFQLESTYLMNFITVLITEDDLYKTQLEKLISTAFKRTQFARLFHGKHQPKFHDVLRQCFLITFCQQSRSV